MSGLRKQIIQVNLIIAVSCEIISESIQVLRADVLRMVPIEQDPWLTRNTPPPRKHQLTMFLLYTEHNICYYQHDQYVTVLLSILLLPDMGSISFGQFHLKFINSNSVFF